MNEELKPSPHCGMKKLNPCVDCQGKGYTDIRWLGNPYWSPIRDSFLHDYEKIGCKACNGQGVR